MGAAVRVGWNVQCGVPVRTRQHHGDTASAIPVLAALAVVLLAQFRARNGLHVVHLWAVAGALIGLAVALKLTNALYALALVPAVLCDGGRLRSRVLALSVLAGVALLVLLLVAGPWYWQVWQHLGNPLFPQFNGVFKSPLAQPVSIADVRWLPRTIGEQLIWPLLFTLKPQRIGDLGLVQAGWAVLYGVVAIAAGRALVRRPVRAAAVDRAAIVLLVFFGVAYALWQAIFSIHRYLVVLELLAPLVLWIVCRHAFAARANRKAAWLIGACALVAVVGWKDWGMSPGRARASRWSSRCSGIPQRPVCCWSATNRNPGACRCCRRRRATSGLPPISPRPTTTDSACVH